MPAHLLAHLLAHLHVHPGYRRALQGLATRQSQFVSGSSLAMGEVAHAVPLTP